MWRFPSGAKIYFGAMQHTNDRFKYQGRAYDYIAFDELTQFYPGRVPLSALAQPRVRPRHPGLSAGLGKPGRHRARLGQGTVFDPGPAHADHLGGCAGAHTGWGRAHRARSRIFVPSTVFDNQILLQNDPAYAARLAALPDADRRALLYGDWDAFAGQVFSEWRADPAHYADRRYTHVVDPFPHSQRMARGARVRLRLFPAVLGRVVGHQPGRCALAVSGN